MLTETHPPSKYAKYPVEAKKTLQDKGISICDHRSEVGDNVTLYYPKFQEFVEECNNQEPITKCDIESARRMCEAMSPHLTKEKERRDTFVQLMKKEYGIKMEEHKFQYKLIEKSACPCDAAVKPNSCVILECKNESGKGGGSDSHSQVIAYYIASLEEKPVDQCPAPAYLIELVGPQLTISGAVYGRDVFVDKLKDVSLEPQCNEEEMIKIAKILKALKHAIEEIKKYYDKKYYDNGLDPRYPTFQSLNRCTIKYTETIKPHMFKGIFTNSERSRDVVIKFVNRFSTEAHTFMYDKGHAPELIDQGKVKGTKYTAIVMEYTCAISLQTYLKSYAEKRQQVQEKCQEVITEMNEEYVHGKLSAQNILLLEEECDEDEEGIDGLKIYIVNYEWAEKKERETFSFSEDTPGVQLGGPGQDLSQLEKLFQELTIN